MANYCWMWKRDSKDEKLLKIYGTLIFVLLVSIYIIIRTVMTVF